MRDVGGVLVGGRSFLYERHRSGAAEKLRGVSPGVDEVGGFGLDFL